MTDQEKADLELSLAMIDQAVSSEKVTTANKDLTEAVNMEVDASLDLTESKVKSKKAVDTETNVTNKSSDIIDDLNYSRSEQARAEKRYLNILDRREEIERKIGLVNYSQIENEIHKRVSEELEKRLKDEEERRKKKKENDEAEDEETSKRLKSDSEYRKQAEEQHKKREGLFKKMKDGHKNYMSNSSSFTGRMAMGSLGKGSSELLNLIDNVTDQIPGAKIAKSVGGFVRDQWKESREVKRQNKIEKTAGFLKAKDAGADTEKLKQKDRDKDQKKGTNGIIEMSGLLSKIFGFLKKMSEMMMIMGIFKSVVGVIGNIAGIIGSTVTTLLEALGITSLLSSLLGVLNAIGMKMGLPDFSRNKPTKGTPEPVPTDKDKKPSKDKPKPDSSKTPSKTPKKKPPAPSKKGGGKGGFVTAILTWLGLEAVSDGEDVMGPGGPSNDELAILTAMPGGVGGKLVALSLYPTKAGVGSDDVSKFADPERQERIQKMNKANSLKGYSAEYKDDMQNSIPLTDKDGNVQYYPNLNNDAKIEAENRRRFKMDVNTGLVNDDADSFKALQKAANELKIAEDAKKETQRNQIITSMGQQSISNTYNNQTKVNQLVGSPNERTKRDTDSRGVTR